MLVVRKSYKAVSRVGQACSALTSKRGLKVYQGEPPQDTYVRPPMDPIYHFMNDGTKRTGLVARKLGMSQTFDQWGRRLPITILQVAENVIVGHRTEETDGYTALRIGYHACTEKKLNKPELGQYKKHNISPRRYIQEFKVTKNALIDIGSELSCAHFMPGQVVDIRGTTIGKGFQGVMKRHNFKGMPASHGVTKTHRKMGGTGGGQDPGRVWKGKKMAGRMGGKNTIQYNLLVYRIDTRWNLITVVGSVPGAKNSFVYVEDPRRTPLAFAPVPTILPDEVLPAAYDAHPSPLDPLV